MIQFSVVKDLVHCTTEDVLNLKQLARHICDYDWSPGIYKNGYRNLLNFERMDVIALDFDGGITIKEIKPKLVGFSHIIGTSRNHRKEKKKKSGNIASACDRFRVVFMLSKPIKTDSEYKATFEWLKQQFPEADPQCKDASRFFYKCKKIIRIRLKGRSIDPVKAPEPSSISSNALQDIKNDSNDDSKGILSKQTLNFIALGAPDGEWNGALFKAANDLMEQGYTEEEATELLHKPTGHLDNQDIKTIQSAFKREPRYEKRTKKETEELAFTESITSLEIFDDAIKHLKNPNATSGISTGWKEVNEILGGLRESELGVVQSYPKTGKTTFLTNLMANLTATGVQVGFASLEMHPAKQVEPDLYSILMHKNIRKEKLTDEIIENIRQLLTNGRGITYYKREKRPEIENVIEWCRRIYGERGIKHIFIDHFHKLVPDEDSRSSINRTITELSSLKYELPELHIMLVVQPTKEGDFERRVGRKTLRGGASIFDELDYLINIHGEYIHKWDEECGHGDNTWIKKHKEFKKYPRDIRELEFEAIRAKPWSDGMGKSIHMKYDSGTMLMIPTTYYKQPGSQESDEEYEKRTRGTSKQWQSKKL